MLAIADIASMIEEAIQAVPGTVDESTNLGSLTGWDSMGLVIFIELTQERAGKALAVHDLRACANCADVLRAIEAAASS
jgi:acyl carrier protein